MPPRPSVEKSRDRRSTRDGPPRGAPTTPCSYPFPPPRRGARAGDADRGTGSRDRRSPRRPRPGGAARSGPTPCYRGVPVGAPGVTAGERHLRGAPPVASPQERASPDRGRTPRISSRPHDRNRTIRPSVGRLRWGRREPAPEPRSSCAPRHPDPVVDREISSRSSDEEHEID